MPCFLHRWQRTDVSWRNGTTAAPATKEINTMKDKLEQLFYFGLNFKDNYNCNDYVLSRGAAFFMTSLN